VRLFADDVTPPDAVVLGEEAPPLVAVVAPAPALVEVEVEPEPACSEAPSSVPQLLLYHVMTCC